MSVISEYKYQAEVTSAEGLRLGDLPLPEPDFQAALQWAFLQGLSAGRTFEFSHPESALVEPVWDERLGRPFVSHLRVILVCDDQQPYACDISAIGFLKATVQTASSSFVDSGTLRVGELFNYKVCAMRNFDLRVPPASDGSPGRQVDDDDFSGVPVANRFTIDAKESAPLLVNSVRRGNAVWVDRDVPAFFPNRVVDELIGLAEGVGDVETGAVLVGNLFRDSDGGLFTEIAAQIPARHTLAERASLTFTAETWAAVDAAIKLRGRGERIVGWAHSHPFFCRNCSPQERRLCPLGSPMFSQADRNVHRAVFGLAHQLALLLSFLGDDQPSVDLFGWREGRIAARGFHTF